MKNFVKENWYKLMIGCSMFIFSVSALIYSVAPVRAGNTDMNNLKSSSGDYTYFLTNTNAVYYHLNTWPNSQWSYATTLGK